VVQLNGRRVLRALVGLAPSGLRRLVARRSLRRRYGLAGLGEEFGYQIANDVTFGTDCRLGGPAYIISSAIGDHTYIEMGCRISHARVGRFCSIAPYALIGLAEHPTESVSTHPMFYRHIPILGYDLVDEDVHAEMRPTSIGNDVWIGAGAVVRGGVTVGDGAVIGAGAVVTSDVPPYAVYGGVPARLIRFRFEKETISALLELRWWDRDLGWLQRRASLMHDVEAFIGKVQASPDA
jgi:acetyltransferase-like isoleucine patch superfamily enzyme